MSEKERFKEIKGNCVDLITIGAADHCTYNEEDCKMSRCPTMKEHEEPIIREETQCPVCGSIIAPHEMEIIKRSWKPFRQGMIGGVLGCIGLIIGLWVFITFAVENLKIVVTFL